MTPHIQTLLHWLHFFLIVAAVCATSFPITYAFTKWYSTLLGRALMLRGVSFALALDVTVLFQYWHLSNLDEVFWIEVFTFGFIAVAAVVFTIMFIKIQFGEKHKYETKYDGTLEVKHNEEGKKIFLLSLDSDVDELDKKEVVIFRVSSE